jgi:hypothetical protein
LHERANVLSQRANDERAGSPIGDGLELRHVPGCEKATHLVNANTLRLA